MFQEPNHTQTPNSLFDELLPLLGFAELKVVLIICRKTFGYHKRKDQISISQLMKLTGLARQRVLDACKSLIDKKIIEKKVIGKQGLQKAFFQIIFTSLKKRPPPVSLRDPQKKRLNKEKKHPLTPSEKSDVDEDLLLKNRIKNKWLKKGRSPITFEKIFLVYEKQPMGSIHSPENWMEVVYKNENKKLEMSDLIEKRKEHCKGRPTWSIGKDSVHVISGAICTKYKLNGNEEFWEKQGLGICHYKKKSLGDSKHSYC